MPFIFRIIVSPLARTWKVRSRERSLSYDLQMTRRGRLRAEANGWTAGVARKTEEAPLVEDQAMPEPAFTATVATENEPMDTPVESPLIAEVPLHAADPEDDAPPTMSASDLVTLAQAQDLDDLLRSPLGKAIQRYLNLRYPHLQEYEDLILAEAGDLLHTDLGRQLVVMDPGEFVEATVRRAIITVAEIRVGLRQAVRSRLAANRQPTLAEPAAQAVERLAAH